MSQIISQPELADQQAARFARLGKWAQQYITDLERKVGELEARVAALSQGPAGSDTVVDGLGTYPDRELGLGAIIGFRLPTATIEAKVSSHGYLNISSEDGALIVQPYVSNVLRIRPGQVW
jgi:hypothetical protein